MTPQTALYWSGQLLEHYWRSHIDPSLSWGPVVFADVETLSPESLESESVLMGEGPVRSGVHFKGS